MKITIGSDHRGFEVKSKAVDELKKNKHQVEDIGTHSTESCDYPEIAHKVAKSVAEGRAERGILVCASGIGMAITANKVAGIRAALCTSLESAKLSRQHNDANVLVLSADEIRDPLNAVILAWLKEDFEGGRHERRVKQIAEIEKKENRKGNG